MMNEHIEVTEHGLVFRTEFVVTEALDEALVKAQCLLRGCSMHGTDEEQFALKQLRNTVRPGYTITVTHEWTKPAPIEESGDDEDEKCPGHPAGPFDPMGETAYCDGSCVKEASDETSE